MKNQTPTPGSTMLLRSHLREIAQTASHAADSIGDVGSVRTLVTGVPSIIHELSTKLTRATVDWAKGVGAEATTQE